MARKSGSLGWAAKRSWASESEKVPVSLLWQVRQVRPLPPNVPFSKMLLPLTASSTVPMALSISISSAPPAPLLQPATSTSDASTPDQADFITRLLPAAERRFDGHQGSARSKDLSDL